MLRHILSALDYFGAVTRPQFVDVYQHLREAWHAIAGTWWPIGSAEEGQTIWREEHIQWPAPTVSQRLHGLHINGIDIWPLFAIDLDVHEAIVHEFGNHRILEGFARHHVAPVTRGVADAHQNRHTALFGRCKCLFTPRIPIYRVVFVLL